MFNESADILNLVLALSILVFTVFLCWLLFTVTRALKKALAIFDLAETVLKGIQDKIQMVESLFKTVEEKVKGFSALAPLVISAVTKIANYLKERSAQKRNKKTKSTPAY